MFRPQHVKILGYTGLVFFILSVVYYITLHINNQDYSPAESIFNVARYFDLSGLDFLIRYLIAVLIYFILFSTKAIRLGSKRYVLHIITLPIYVFFGTIVVYWVKDYLDWFRLQGNARVWDIYIPFLTYCSIFGLAHALEYYEETKNQISARAALEKERLGAEISAIKAHLNPHFLYNTFNSINASIPPEAEQTREMVANFADLFRYQLSVHNRETTTLREEVEFIQKYLELEKIRLGDRLSYTISVSEEVMNAKIQPMLLQPLIENAIIHGISPSIAGGYILLDIHPVNQMLHILVENNNKDGMKSSATGFGIGLSTVKRLLSLVYNKELSVENFGHAGYKVRMEIPYVNHS